MLMKRLDFHLVYIHTIKQNLSGKDFRKFRFIRGFQAKISLVRKGFTFVLISKKTISCSINLMTLTVNLYYII